MKLGKHIRENRLRINLTQEKLAEIYAPTGFPVVSCSTVTGEGIEEVKAMLHGKFSVLAGNSWVGKSSLMNAISDRWQLATGQVSEKLGRGRHTTRHIELFQLDSQTYVADTPGFSSFDTDQMEIVLKENLQYAFPDFAPYLGQCRYHDCSHRAEPNCAVRSAVEDGRIQKTRYESYLRLYEKASQVKEWEIK